jgi:hypothetical protein
VLRIDGKKSADGTTFRKSKLKRRERKETLGQVLAVHPLLKDAERVLLGLPPLPVSAVDAAAAAAAVKTAAAAAAAAAAAPVAAAAPAGGPRRAAGGGKGRKGKGRGPAAMPRARKLTAAAAKTAKAEAARIALMKEVSSEEDSSDDEGYSALKRQRQAMAARRAGTSAADADA